MRNELDRRTFLKRSAQLGTGLLLTPALGACAPDNSGRHTIHTDPRQTEQQRVDAVRAATASHKTQDSVLVLPDERPVWRPGMTRISSFPGEEVFRNLQFQGRGLGRLGVHRARLDILQDFEYRGEATDEYRAFVVDHQGRIVRILDAEVGRADAYLPGAQYVEPVFERFNLVRVSIEGPHDENIIDVIRRGAEVHLETVNRYTARTHAYGRENILPRP